MTKKLAPVFAYQAFVLQLMGRWTEAWICAHQALSLDPDDLVALKVQARIHLHYHRYEAAENTCHQILQQTDAETDPAAWQLFEQALAGQAKADQAENVSSNRTAHLAKTPRFSRRGNKRKETVDLTKWN